MNLRIVVIGKPSQDVARTFLPEYLRRLRRTWPTDVVVAAAEKLDSGRSEADALAREATRIRAKVPEGWPVVALDRTGRQLGSSAFADRLRRWEESAVRGVAFVVGGPAGLDPALVASADLRLSFGPMTFPHDLALVMLAEQVYRAATIVRGHPYHRA